mmetsp:Transcript_21223/g.33477  ORF Transcript_21223/g.33477 Transcript_21223/m.33477 type:complete len:128 (-) Transcript_21223:316-699(-)
MNKRLIRVKKLRHRHILRKLDHVNNIMMSNAPFVSSPMVVGMHKILVNPTSGTDGAIPPMVMISAYKATFPPSIRMSGSTSCMYLLRFIRGIAVLASQEMRRIKRIISLIIERNFDGFQRIRAITLL